MQLKFVSDGTQEGTRVVDAQTGDLLEGVVSVKYVSDVDSESPAILTLQVVDPEIDVQLDNKKNGKVHYYKTPRVNNGFVTCREKLEDEKGQHIAGIQAIQVIADTRSIRMVLTQRETHHTIEKTAAELREQWDKPREVSIDSIASITRKNVYDTFSKHKTLS